MPVTRELLDYVKAQLQAGETEEQIRSVLSGVGWDPNDVDEAFRQAEYEIGMEKAGPQERAPVAVQVESGVRQAKPAQQPQQQKLASGQPGSQQAVSQATGSVAASKYTYGLLLSMIGGGLLMINGVYTLVLRSATTDIFSQFGVALYMFPNDATGNLMFGLFALALGLVVIIVNFLGSRGGRSSLDAIRGLITMLASIIGVFFGGLLIGPIIGVIGGILTVLKR
jgi:hypothetical protein